MRLPELWSLLNFLHPTIFNSCDNFEKWLVLRRTLTPMYTHHHILLYPHSTVSSCSASVSFI